MGVLKGNGIIIQSNLNLKMEEVQLIERCLKKDKKAWDIFVQKYSKLIYWAIRKRLGVSSFEYSQDDIDCIFQEVFLSILSGDKLLQLRNMKTIVSWLAVMTSNKTVDFMRRKIRETKRLVLNPPELKDDRHIQDLFDKDLLNIVNETMNVLSSKEKVIISLNLIENRTHKEISKILCLPVNTVSTVIARTKEKLRKELDKKGIKNF